MPREFWPAAGYPIRYFTVAGVCLVMHNCIVIAASWSGLTMWQAVVLSFCIMVVVGYALLATLVFNVRCNWRAFLRYFSAMAANFPVSSGLLWLFFEIGRLPMVIAAPAATITMVAFNFVVSRWAIMGRFQQTQSARH